MDWFAQLGLCFSQWFYFSLCFVFSFWFLTPFFCVFYRRWILWFICKYTWSFANTGHFTSISILSYWCRYKRVAYLDTDVGQTEFTAPGCLSLTVVDKITPGTAQYSFANNVVYMSDFSIFQSNVTSTLWWFYLYLLLICLILFCLSPLIRFDNSMPENTGEVCTLEYIFVCLDLVIS